MKFIKKAWDKIKNPRLLYLTIFYIFFALILAGTLTLVILIHEQTIWHYLTYVISAISLTYTVYTIVIFAPKLKNKFINFLKKHNFTNTLLKDYGYRTIIFSIFSFSLNVIYLTFLSILGIVSGSVWYISIAAYYLVLSLMKGSIFYSKKKFNDINNQLKTYRYCGIMFIFLTIALSGIIVLIYKSNMAFEYAGLIIYAVAAYTFYKLTLSIINILKARKQDDLFIQSIRNINLASALVSIVVLQVALFQEFSPANNTSFANALTGGVISSLILALGIYMIIKSNKILKTQEEIITNDKQ